MRKWSRWICRSTYIESNVECAAFHLKLFMKYVSTQSHVKPIVILHRSHHSHCLDECAHKCNFTYENNVSAGCREKKKCKNHIFGFICMAKTNDAWKINVQFSLNFRGATGAYYTHLLIWFFQEYWLEERGGSGAWKSKCVAWARCWKAHPTRRMTRSAKMLQLKWQIVSLMGERQKRMKKIEPTQPS